MERLQSSNIVNDLVRQFDSREEEICNDEEKTLHIEDPMLHKFLINRQGLLPLGYNERLYRKGALFTFKVLKTRAGRELPRHSGAGIHEPSDLKERDELREERRRYYERFLRKLSVEDEELTLGLDEISKNPDTMSVFAGAIDVFYSLRQMT